MNATFLSEAAIWKGVNEILEGLPPEERLALEADACVRAERHVRADPKVRLFLAQAIALRTRREMREIVEDCFRSELGEIVRRRLALCDDCGQPGSAHVSGEARLCERCLRRRVEASRVLEEEASR